jgi:beta-lactamase regulating signal transducer with metallopeptidase domain
MMMADLLLALAHCNLVAGVAILAVLALRSPLRRWFGPGPAYTAWLVVPLAAAGSLMPVDLSPDPAGVAATTDDRMFAWLSAGDHAAALGLIWLGGGMVSLAVMALRHWRFCAAVKEGGAGPAVVGVFQPRFVTPKNFAERFTFEERRLIRAHELAHVDRLDARYNALAALATCVCWFNPLLHLGMAALRLDQELACDATVLGRLPGARRRYAETLLRSHQTAATPVLGCQWRSSTIRALEVRVGMLMARAPSDVRRDTGAAIVLAACIAMFAVAWTTQPPSRAAARAAAMLTDLTSSNQPDVTLQVRVYRILEKPAVKPHQARRHGV